MAGASTVVVTMAADFMGAALPDAAGIMTAFEVADSNMKASRIAASFVEAPTAVFTVEAGSTEAVTADTANSPGFCT